MSESKRPLKVFLCHAHADSASVRALYAHLTKDGVDAWLDKEKLLPGQDWELEIRKAVRESDVVVVCLSRQFNQAGFRQKEVRLALDTAMEQPEGDIFIIPARLQECDDLESLRKWHRVDLFEDDGYERLMRALRARADKIGATLQAKRGWLPKITTPRSTKQKFVDSKKSEKSQKKTVEIKRDIPNDALPPIDDILPPADTFPAGWDSEWQPSFESEKAIGEATEKAKSEKTERERAEREVAEKSKREKAERQDVRKAYLEKTISKSFSALKSTFTKAIPFFRIVGVIGIIIILFWGGTLAMPKFLSLIPTANATATLKITSTNSPAFPTNNTRPSATPTKTQTPIPTALPAEITDPKGVKMVLVPAGSFIMGADYGPDDAKPKHNVYLDDFYIDKFEVTNASYKNCVDVYVCQKPQDLSSYSRLNYYGYSEFENYPVIYVDKVMSETYCGWREARLPTEEEWEKAARGTDGRTYPWGNERRNNYANENGNIGDTSFVGRYEGGESVYSVYDIAGNVWEWVSSPYVEYPQNGNDGPEYSGNFYPGFGVLRGGSFSSNWIESYYRYWNLPTLVSSDVGFRCARSISESTVSSETPAPLPALTLTAPTTYTLQKGEFTYCIARRFNVDPDELLEINEMASTLLT